MKKATLHQRLKARNRSQLLIIGVTWYTEESWAQVKASATDPECFEESYKKWKAAAVKARSEFQRSGVRAVECQIVPEEFFAWCAVNGHENNSASRADFVSETLIKAYNSND